MTTPEAAALADALDRAIVYTSQSHDGAVTVLPVETARNLIAYLEVAGYALTPLAPEVPPRRDEDVEEAVARAIYDDMRMRDSEGRNRPWVPGGNSLKQSEARQRARTALAATRTPEPPDSGDGAALRGADAALPPNWTLLMGREENRGWWATASEPRDPATRSFRIVSTSHDGVLYGSPTEALDVLTALLRSGSPAPEGGE